MSKEYLKRFVAGVMIVAWLQVMHYLLYPERIEYLPAPTSFLKEWDGWYDR